MYSWPTTACNLRSVHMHLKCKVEYLFVCGWLNRRGKNIVVHGVMMGTGY